jgi:cellulose synthase/poly-beta-1,6-N-acetylglucosamine synthase-like glycosyltransferase
MTLSLTVLILILQGLVTLCLAYLYLLALAGVRQPNLDVSNSPAHCFAVAIPAHDEEATIGRTVERLKKQGYPSDQFDIFVVADNCNDDTARVAREAGAICLERHDSSQRGKGYALAWLFQHILDWRTRYDAVVVFDADTSVDSGFLKVMDAMLRQGHQVIQGKHVIANPAQGWFAAVMYTAFVMDNRLRNQGRSNLGLSSKLMGDAMCFARQVLEAHPWQAASLTEDAEYRAALLLNGIRVAFAPQAIAYGEMVTSLGSAHQQRARWMRGRAEVTRRLAPRLLHSGLRNLDWPQLEGALELAMPSYSTLLMVALLTTGLWSILPDAARGLPWLWLVVAWAGFLAYPPLGLLLEQAPAKLYLYLAFAPFYTLWRTGLRLWVRFRHSSTAWVRTPRSTETVQNTVRLSSLPGASDESKR